MKNFVQPGENITIASPADVVSGQGVLVGDLFGVASGDAVTGADVVLSTVGVFELPKVTTDAITVGAKVYWSGTAVTVTVTGDPIGNAISAGGNPSSTVRVRLSV